LNKCKGGKEGKEKELNPYFSYFKAGVFEKFSGSLTSI
jgi:hypothetical protein